MNDQFSLTAKQMEVIVTANNAPYEGVEEIFLIGPIGTSKTFAMAALHINVAFQFEDCIIPVARKDMAEAQITTWPVYLEALDLMGLQFGVHYTIREATNDLRIKFMNDSIIQFIGLNKSRDRQWSKAKVTSTMAGVDEVDDVDEDGYDVLYSRTGRRNRSGAPRVIVSCCNPNDAWIKRKIYLPWLKRNNDRREGISDEEWDAIEPLDPKKVVIEFNMEDSVLYPSGYYDRFMDRPLSWRQRFLLNNWNYIDDENSLFKARAMDTMTIWKLKRGEKFLGVDPNAGGPDRACIAMWEDDVLVDVEVYTTKDLEKRALPEETSPMNYGAILGRLTVEKMQRERIGYNNVGGDIVGIGQGWLTYMLSNGYKVMQFRSGDAPIQTATEKAKNIKPPFFDLRSQMFGLWAQDVTNGKTYFYGDMPHLSALKKELQLHEGDATSKVLRVTPKPDIKKLLGASPDIADGAMVGYWVRMLRKGRTTSVSDRASVGTSVDEMYNNSNAF
jgi:hypothetical protein